MVTRFSHKNKLVLLVCTSVSLSSLLNPAIVQRKTSSHSVGEWITYNSLLSINIWLSFNLSSNFLTLYFKAVSARVSISWLPKKVNQSYFRSAWEHIATIHHQSEESSCFNPFSRLIVLLLFNIIEWLWYCLQPACSCF